MIFFSNINMNRVLIKTSSNPNLSLKTVNPNKLTTFNSINSKTKSISNMQSIKLYKIIVQRSKLKIQMHQCNIKVAKIKILNKNKMRKTTKSNFHTKNKK